MKPEDQDDRDCFGLKQGDIARIREVFERDSRVGEAILYGSRAKGSQKTGSDIDLALKGKGLNLQALNEINLKLDDLLLPYIFDLSIYDRIDNPDLLDHIKRVGKVFYQTVSDER
jgi:uncharacterized protein